MQKQDSPSELKASPPENERVKLLLEASNETGVAYSGVAWIEYAILDELQKVKGSIDAKMIVRNFISHIAQSQKDVKATLQSWQIKDSDDVGKVVLALCDRLSIIKKENADTLESYQHIFTTEHIDAFIKAEKLSPTKDYRHKISYVLYFLGTAIILLSYINVVSSEVGWFGWIIGMAGWALSFFKPTQKR